MAMSPGLFGCKTFLPGFSGRFTIFGHHVLLIIALINPFLDIALDWITSAGMCWTYLTPLPRLLRQTYVINPFNFAYRYSFNNTFPKVIPLATSTSSIKLILASATAVNLLIIPMIVGIVMRRKRVTDQVRSWLIKMHIPGVFTLPVSFLFGPILMTVEEFRLCRKRKETIIAMTSVLDQSNPLPSFDELSNTDKIIVTEYFDTENEVLDSHIMLLLMESSIQ